MVLRTTAEYLLDRIVTQRDGLAIGQPMVYSAARDQSYAVAGLAMLTVPKGQVFVLTQLVFQPDYVPILDTPGSVPSPNQTASSFFGFAIKDTAASTKWNVKFMPFVRWQQTFEFQDSPNWRNAPPGNFHNWRPRYGIAIPAGWSIYSHPSINTLGNAAAIYGVLMSEENARSLGYSVYSTTTATDLNVGVASALTTASSVELIAAKTGKSIRILDVALQLQPETATSNVLTIEQYDGTTAKSIWQIGNKNPSDFVDQKFSPDIYLKPGASLRIKSTVANTAAVTISYEYVETKDVPGDHWWSCTIPDQPTPSLGTSGSLSNAVTTSTQVTCYYPKYDTTTTSPTTGYQYILNGYTVSIQKDTSTSTEQLFVGVFNGSSGAVYSTTFSLGSGIQMSPVITAAGHDQCVVGCVDHIALPGKQNDGSFYIGALNTGVGGGLQIVGIGVPATPSSGTAQIDSWSVTLWGRRIPNRFTDPSNQGG